MKNQISCKPIIGFLLYFFTFSNSAFTQNMDSPDAYTKKWEEIDKLLQEDNLPKSALEKINEVWAYAIKQQDEPQQVKALIYWSDATSKVSESTKDTLLPVWLEKVESASGAQKAVLQSILAEMIWNYLENNRWTIHDRTNTSGFEKQDMATWSEKDFESEVTKLYLTSVEDLSVLNIPIGKYSSIILPGNNSSTLRPSLSDVLISRAIDHFTNTRAQLNKPVKPFRLTDPALFDVATKFMVYAFPNHDTISPDYLLVNLMQRWLAFHAKDANVDAFLDADLRRLDFVNSNSPLKQKVELFRAALNNLILQNKNNPLTARVYAKLVQSYMKSGEEWDGISELKKWDLKLAHSLAVECIQAYPNAMEIAECIGFKMQLEQTTLEITLEETNQPSKPVLAFLKYGNSKALHFRIIKNSESIQKAIAELNNSGNIESVLNYLKSLDFVQSGGVDLSDPGDFRKHSTEFKIDPLVAGEYIIFFSSDKDFKVENSVASSFTSFKVSDLAIMIGTEGETTDILVTNRSTGAPLKDISVKVTEVKSIFNGNNWEIIKKVLFKKLKPDKDGFIRVKLGRKQNEYDLNYLIEASYKKDNYQVSTGGSYYREKQPDNSYFQTYLYTDRSIYRPGQTIYFKGLLAKRIGRKSEISANNKVTISFFNTNSQKVEEKTFTTNQFGSFDGTFTAPTSGMKGQMYLNSDKGGVQWISVEEYKRPTFEVVFDKIEGEYKLNDKVIVKLKAQAFAGNELTGADVVYRVIRKTAFPYWSYFKYLPYNISTQEIIQGTAKTNDQGNFSFQFPLVPDDADDPSRKPIYTFEVIADITDQAGETRTGSTQVSAGYVGVNVQVQIDETYEPGSKFEAKFKLLNLNDQETKTDATVRISRLVSPSFIIKSKYWEQPEYQLIPENTYRKDFPNFAYKYENNPENWVQEAVSFDEKYTGSQELELNIANWKPGKYKFEIEVKDYAGNPVKTERYFTILSPKRQANFYSYGLSVTTDKSSYQPGEKALVKLESPGIKYPVWVEFVKKDQVTSAYWLNVKDVETIEIPISEEDRGNFSIRFYYSYDNRKFEDFQIINVPWTNKELKIEYLSFRDKLMPGQNESWKIKLSGISKDKVMAELTATMYDASLDVFRTHNWYNTFFEVNNYSRSRYNTFGFGPVSQNVWANFETFPSPNIDYPAINFFGFYPSLADRRMYMSHMVMSMDAPRASPTLESEHSAIKMKGARNNRANEKLDDQASLSAGVSPPTGDLHKAKPEFTLRQNLKETVFFFPAVITDSDGNYILDFKMNEALTKWKLLLFAHTKELAYIFDSKMIVTQKDLMIQPNMPRFLRQGDEVILSARISNLSEGTIEGVSSIQLLDAISGQDVTKLFCTVAENNFNVGSKQNVATEWKVSVPLDWSSPLEYKVIARSELISDGEGSVLPVLTDKILVTETLPLPVKAGQSKTFTFKSLKENTSNTLKPVQYALEFTANPVWYAVKALPYLAEYPHECSEQIFSRIYANVLAAYVANKNPKFKEYYDKWKVNNGLQSNLSKNQDLKNTILEETPWVQNAMGEEEQMQKISMLFDLNRIQNETNSAFEKLVKRQQADGGFGWFPGYQSDWYITQYIIEGFEHLYRLKVLPASDEYNRLILNGKSFIDRKFEENFLALEKLVKEGKAKWEDDHLSEIILHYLYTSSFDPIGKKARSGNLKRAYDYYLSQTEKYWTGKMLYEQGLAALVTYRNNLTTTSNKIVKSLKENAIYNEELGMYWKSNWGYYWYQMPIETQSLMIEVFDEVANDQKSVDELRIWLLKNKQTNNWKTTKATSEAIYALLLTGSDWVSQTKMPEIKVGKKKLDLSKLNVEPGSGYFKLDFPKSEISSDLSQIEVSNPNKSIAWGGVYWQYFEKMDKVNSFEQTPLKIIKNYFIVKNSDAGPVMSLVSDVNPVKLGDKVRVRIEIRVDRMMEYVHLKDLRGSGFEPVNVFSEFKFQGGLGYYESTRDVATDFFISYLPKGTYVFEYDLRANNKGEFSMGISTMQCMYAPEFSSHSTGERIEIK